MKPGLRIHIALDIQDTPQRLGPAEKHACFRGSVDRANRPEDHVPVRTAEARRRAETGDGVLFCVGVVDHDVCCVVGSDVCGDILDGAETKVG